MSKQALGRGFDSLIPVNLKIDDVASPGEHVRKMAISDIVVNPGQPRKSFDRESLDELAQSIKQHGVIQPLVVTPYKDKFRIVAGERRYRASKLADLDHVPVIVRNHAELEELEIALVENVQRVDLSPLEQAVSIVRLHDQFSMSFKDIAKKLGKAETTISNTVRLLQLPENALEALSQNKISEGHARAILALKTDKKLQDELLNKIVVQGWSVRQAETFAKDSKGIQKAKTTKYQNSAETQKLLKNISKMFAGRLSIKEKSAEKGSIVISYSSKNELKETLDKLNS